MLSSIKNHWLLCKNAFNSTKVRTEVYDNLDTIKNIWDGLLPSNHHLSHASLNVLSHANLEDLVYKYILVYDEKEVIGCIYLQILQFNHKHYDNSVLEKPQFYLVKSFVLKQHIHLLVCGNLFRINFQGFYFKNQESNALIFDILSDYSKNNNDKQNFCGILIKDVEKPASPVVIQEKRFQPFKDDITMELYIRNSWIVFDDYLKNLSRKYLQRAKKILKANESIQKRKLSIEDMNLYGSRIEELYKQVALSQSIRMGILNVNYFIELKKYYHESFEMLGYFVNDELVAFSTYIYYQDSMEIHFIGFDYQKNEAYKLYFNILFDGIKIAIEKKLQRIELGRTAKEAKASAGAVSADIYNYIKLKHGLPSLAFSFFNSFFNSNVGDSWKSRNPFKESV